MSRFLSWVGLESIFLVFFYLTCSSVNGHWTSDASQKMHKICNIVPDLGHRMHDNIWVSSSLPKLKFRKSQAVFYSLLRECHLVVVWVSVVDSLWKQYRNIIIISGSPQENKETGMERVIDSVALFKWVSWKKSALGILLLWFVCNPVCVVSDRKPGVTGRGLYKLRPECAKMFNLYFHHYSRADQSKVTAR